ncbi:DUF1684 domain-containing protein [Salarchaeum sp. III]|uniref:DUF1684 domain-containing protein n=1 Tax=Salarchaeum sp. III TaxID=3107927 RepID=UPI002EDAB27D
MAEPDLDRDAWRERVREHRAEKRQFVRENMELPETGDDLVLYDIDPEFRVVARLQRAQNPEVVRMELTRGPAAEYERAATLGFTLGGDHHVLAGYHAPNQDGLFVPFTDETSGDDTPKIGRYVELDVAGVESGSQVALDFNLAYLPFCVLDESYASPVPPERNHVPVAIRAGEKHVEIE